MKKLKSRNMLNYLAGKIFDCLRPDKKNPKLTEEITALHAGKPESVRVYYTKKISSVLLCILLTAMICIPAAILLRPRSDKVEGGRIKRPDYGESAASDKLLAKVKGETEEREISVHVGERKYTKKEVNTFLEQAEQEFAGEMLGENASEDEVRSELVFPRALQDGRVTVEYLTIPYGVLSEEGKIEEIPDEGGKLVEIKATFSCQGEQRIYECAVRVLPPLFTDEENLWREVEEGVRKADEENTTDEYLKLPDKVRGKKIIWYRRTPSWSAFFLILLVILPFLVYERMDAATHESAEKRKQELIMDYPQLLWKMSMLLGAGLTLRGTFQKIAAQSAQMEHPRSAYVEVARTCREMDSGIGESSAYQNFGRRCALPQYVKLGSILAQNLKKGSRGLPEELAREVSEAMEERRAMARRLGEKAGTRMLFPMTMMLLVVLMLLIVPAFLSM